VKSSAPTMLRSVVCDAGGILVAAGALEGIVPDDAEILALDWSSVTLARFLAARHDGHPGRIKAELGLVLSGVHEWFPVRTLMALTMGRAGPGAIDSLDSWSAVLLAEQLNLALFTASNEVQSDQIEIIRPW
jgi:hypothetical protein